MDKPVARDDQAVIARPHIGKRAVSPAEGPNHRQRIGIYANDITLRP